MKIYGLIESEEFTLALTLVGEPIKADEKLADILFRIATDPESFRIVLYPNERMATRKIGRLTIVIFFRILPDANHIELLRPLLKTA